ncbi:MAG: hypothetical protein ACLQPD_33220 [Desulfomonilaceae bacterium]
MSRNRVWLFGVVLSLGVLLLAMPATAWEFNMTGSYTWDYQYITQLGTGGFFGEYNVDNRAGANLNTANAWLGYQPNNLVQIGNLTAITPGPPASANQNVQQQGSVIVSGADASWNKMWMDVNMEVRINPALRVRGLYHIGEWATGTTVASLGTQTTDGFQTASGEQVQSEYQNFRFPGVKRSFSPGYWNTLWLTAQLPWGELAIGKRPSTWGTGLIWNGEDSRSSEQLTLFAVYGPLRIGAGFYPSRTGSEGFANDVFDKSGIRQYDFTFPNIIYRNGPLDAGVQFNWIRRHRGGDRRNDVAANLSKLIGYRDRDDFYGGIYAKYNNGRFFWNAELDWYDRIDRLGRQAAFVPAGSVFPNGIGIASDAYMQHYRVMTELGWICGPAKLSLLYSWSSGNDRRGIIPNQISGSIANINQGTLVEPTNFISGGVVQSNNYSNTGLYRPYSFLMVYSYGLGTHIQGDTGNGYVEDASCFAGRLDYAVAANLNLYGSFFWADRVGNAYGWGFLKPLNTAATTPAVINSGYAMVAGTLTGAPTIPDNNLGYEFDAGFDWKLLEGLTLNATFAYWQPGKWFNFACIDKSMAAWDTPTAAGNSFGINPNRSINGIWAADIKIVGDF